MRTKAKFIGLAALALATISISGCSSDGARPTYHMSTSGAGYWGGYGYHSGRYYGGYSHRYIGRPAYGRGYGRYGRW